jgi:hypothetical protein
VPAGVEERRKKMADNPNYPIATAVVSWFDSSSALHIRVYSSDGYNVSERCMDQGASGWTTGGFNAPGSAVSATSWNASDGTHLRVYCTNEDTTTEYCNDPGTTGWTQGSYTTE